MELNELAIQFLAGLSRAGLLFVVSAGLSLVFGTLRIINLAHGSLYMLGAFVTATAVATFGAGAGFVAAVVLAAVVAAAAGALIEAGVLRRLYRSEHLLQLLATYALVIVIADLVELGWGTQNRSVPRPGALAGAIDISGGRFPVYNLFVVVAALAIGALLWFVVNRTGLGREIRAAIADPEMLGGVGVNVRLLFSAVFALGAGLAGIAGALVAPAGSVGLGMDIDIIVEAFAVTIIGGLGSISGALVGAGIVGMLDSFGILLFPRLTLALVFLALAAVLAVRPSGLFGKPERA